MPQGLTGRDLVPWRINQFDEIIGFTKSDFANSRFEKFGEKIVFAVERLILKRCICVRGVCDR